MTTWFAFLFWGMIGFGCVAIIVLGVLTRPRRGYNPLVEPAPDAFPLRYRSPVIERPRGKSGTIPVAGYINGRPYRLDNDGAPIYGYQPISRSYPAWEPAPYVKDEPLHEERQ